MNPGCEVLVFNINGKQIKKYPSKGEAAKKEGLSLASLSKYINEGTVCARTGHMYDLELKEKHGKCL